MRWTEDEDAILKSWKGKKIKDVLPKLPGREYTAVRARMVQLGLTEKHMPWTEEDDAVLRTMKPLPNESRAKFYARVLPHRGGSNCHHRYQMLLGDIQ